MTFHAQWLGKKRSKRHERVFTIVMSLKRKRSVLSIKDKNEDADDIVFQMICKSVVYNKMSFLVSKETVVLRRWERSKQKFGFIKRVDKG